MLRRVVLAAGITRPAAIHTPTITTTAAAPITTASRVSSVSSFTCMPRLSHSQSAYSTSPTLEASTSLRQSRLYMSQEATAAAAAATAATSTNFSTNTAQTHSISNKSASSADATVVTKMNFTPEVLDNRITAMHAAGKHVKVYVDAHLIAWIAMDRASSSANALGQEFVQDLNTALDYVEQMVNNGTVKVAVLTSSKTTFCVGADIDQMYHVTDINVARAIPAEGHKLFNRIAAEPFPVVAAINGLALGGGFELALSCHARVIAANAKVGFPECLLGLLPGGGGTVRTQRLCGLPTTVKWILSSKQIPAHTAYKCGACDAVIDADDRWHNEHRFFAEVRKWVGQRAADKPSSLLRAQRKSRISYVDYALAKTRWGRKKVADEALKMLNKQTKGKYIAQYKALECVMYAATHSNQEGFVKETNSFAELLCTPEAKNQMSLYFLDEGMKKSETKTGIAKSEVPTVGKVAVIGAGVMGSGIAHHFVNKGVETTMQDVKSEMIDKGMAMVRDELSKAVHKHKMTLQEMHKKLHLLSGSTSVEALQGADVVVEAAIEVMDIKKKIIANLEQANVLTESNLFASNTSSLSVTEMQSSTKYAANVVGMHFFNPVAKMPLVEVIKGKDTSELATAIIFNLALRTGKKPIIVNDSPGFIVNRILGVYMAEAGRMVANEKCNPFVIDEAITRFGMPMGPFRLLDEVGIDVACHVAPVLENGLHSNRFKVDDNLLVMMRDGLLGKKTHQGFYLYDKKDVSRNTSVVDKYYGSDLRATVPEQEIIDRCVLLMVNEASLILSDKIAQSAEDVDIGMVWGTGFPAYRGGLLQYADHRGLDNIVKRLNELHSKTSHEYFQPTQLLKDMAAHQKRFFPNRPYVPYQERNGYPAISFE